MDAASARKLKFGLMVGALGVVYGDIGTSPLYAMSETFFGTHPIDLTPENALGVASLVLWSLLLIVTLKYVMLVLRADNHGEGGIFALLALLGAKQAESGNQPQKKLFRFVTLIIPLGAALLCAEGMITPAISVLSAVEGLPVVAPAAAGFVLPLTLGILVALFWVQRRGTHRIAAVFGPIMLVWFGTLATLGLYRTLENPEILAAINPVYAFRLLYSHSGMAIFILGAIMLAFTGVEALYADLGHFGRSAIRYSWNLLVLPSLALNYLGQGAMVLGEEVIVQDNLFYSMAPEMLRIPLLILATMATIIASQALISGVFSLAQQAMALGLSPRLKVIHTNPDMQGQIFIPLMNQLLFVGAAGLVLGFRDSGALAAAYGLAVTGAMTITTLAIGYVAYMVWGWNRWLVLLMVTALLTVDITFLSSNVAKLAHGAWVPLVIAGALFAILDTWRWGRTWIRRAYESGKVVDPMTVGELLKQHRTMYESGNSVSLVVMASRPVTRLEDTIPPVMAIHYRNWRTLTKHVIFFSIHQTNQPEIPAAERYRVIPFVQDEAGTIVSVVVKFGYMERPNVRKVLKELKQSQAIKIPQSAKKWLILIGSERFVTQGNSWVERQRLALFSKINRLSKPVTDYFGLESDTGVTMETINV